MNNINKVYSSGKYNLPFSHIYIEETIAEHPRTEKILSHFPKAKKIFICNYMDVYGRYGQDLREQSYSPALILAGRKGEYLYQGAPVCQDFGNRNFYYASGITGCLYDCEYCYLKGKYHSGNIVVFVNLEDTFLAVKKLLEEKPLYICISYDTDLLAVEDAAGFVNDWITFVRENQSKYSLEIEIRTKCARTDLYARWQPDKNVIFAYTLSPREIIRNYEHKTSSLEQRIKAAKLAADMGFSVRLCFDPMIYCEGWQEKYEQMWEEIINSIEIDKIKDFSVGSFRISAEYMKTMRKVMYDSAVVQFPFEKRKGVYGYPERIMHRMEQFMVECIAGAADRDNIFLWEKA